MRLFESADDIRRESGPRKRSWIIEINAFSTHNRSTRAIPGDILKCSAIRWLR
ncbi:hypothetical protein PI125_g5585 [Phytophthora idaei]|nr:hypothetical protein PI125_g5585 [Phytophthora idaei]